MRFKFKVSDGFFPMSFEGILTTNSKEEAISGLKEFYAQELDTTEEYIKIEELIPLDN